jgi:hypothetical protein
VDLERRGVAVASGIAVTVEIVTGELAVDELDAGDLHDAA